METNAFQQYLIDVIGSGFLALSVALGERTGLLKTMCNLTRAATIQEIAQEAGLKERYVAEWLGAMVAGKIVEVDSQSTFYSLPNQYKSVFESTMINMSLALVMCARQQENLQTCFELDGPCGYSTRDYPDYYPWLNKTRASMVNNILDQDIIPQLEDIQDRLESGVLVADIGCGTGNLTCGLARRFPKSTFVGIDYSPEAVKLAVDTSADNVVNNVSFELCDAEKLPEVWKERFDIIFVHDVIHDVCFPDKILSEIHRTLKDGGIFSLVEVDACASHFESKNNLLAAMAYTFSMHTCLPNSMATLAPTDRRSCWGKKEVTDALNKAGFFILRDVPTMNEPNRHFIMKK
ncbi:hypothetical protein ScPMuIL_006001 [Solemya velum]